MSRLREGRANTARGAGGSLRNLIEAIPEDAWLDGRRRHVAEGERAIDATTQPPRPYPYRL